MFFALVFVALKFVPNVPGKTKLKKNLLQALHSFKVSVLNFGVPSQSKNEQILSRLALIVSVLCPKKYAYYNNAIISFCTFVFFF